MVLQQAHQQVSRKISLFALCLTFKRLFRPSQIAAMLKCNPGVVKDHLEAQYSPCTARTADAVGWRLTRSISRSSQVS